MCVILPRGREGRKGEIFEEILREGGREGGTAMSEGFRFCLRMRIGIETRCAPRVSDAVPACAAVHRVGHDRIND